MSDVIRLDENEWLATSQERARRVAQALVGAGYSFTCNYVRHEGAEAWYFERKRAA